MDSASTYLMRERADSRDGARLSKDSVKTKVSVTAIFIYPHVVGGTDTALLREHGTRC